MGMLQKIRQIDFQKGSGEFIAFAVISPLICTLVLIMTAYIQLFMNIRQLNSALIVSSRSVAVCTSMKDAKKQALYVAQSSIKSDQISNVSVDVSYANGDKEWTNGSLLLVSISGDISTIAPYVLSGTRTKSIIVSVENGTYSSSDINLLAATLATESNPTDPEGMLAVGTVIMNRIESGAYPNTMSEVIYQNGQFAVTWESPNFKNYVQCGAPQAALDCAKQIMSGKRNETLMEHRCTQFRTHRYTDSNGRFIDSSTYHPNGIDIGGNWFFW